MEVVQGAAAGGGGGGGERAAAEGGGKCGRWNPTAEQVRLLTELFQAGLRTPSADQIQTISARLSAFGKIESKNVFYWFQNHKARERHHKKRRRQVAVPDDGNDDVGDHFKVRSRCSANCGKTKRPETLELFPLKACSSGEEKVVCGRALFLEKAERDPPLELRLSFL